MQPNLVTDIPGSHDKDVCEGGTSDKPGQDQSNIMHTGVYLGPIGDSGV